MTSTTQASDTAKTVITYLDSLVWDGIPRIDRWLIDYAGANECSALVRRHETLTRRKT